MYLYAVILERKGTKYTKHVSSPLDVAEVSKILRDIYEAKIINIQVLNNDLMVVVDEVSFAAELAKRKGE